MNNVPLYLKPQAYFEPLFNQWYMWPYLLAPVPAAMNLSNHHLRLMKSFVANAKLHAQALKHQSMVGSSIVEVANLDPGQDIKFTVVIDLKGNKELGIEVIANSGANPIREADMINNTLIKYFSAHCY